MGLRTLALSLLAGLCWGCFALDLIDEGKKEMDRYSAKSGKTSEKSAPAVAGGAKAAGEGPTPKESVQKWWSEVRSLAPTEASQGVVRCEIGGATQFTSPEQCAVRGGRVRSLGG